MAIAFDHAKNAINFAKHGLEFGEFGGFDIDPTPIALVDHRRNYGEIRYRAFGRIDGEGYMIAYTVRGDDLWLISFRRTHEKELRKYGL